MFKTIKIVVLVICALMLLFMFLPTGNSADSVVEGYYNTLSYTSSGAAVYQYFATLQAGDPLLNAIEKSAGEHVDYLWVKEDGTPVYAIRNSTFPTRGGPADGGDFTNNPSAWHMGTDFQPVNVDKANTVLWQVAIWDGVVVVAHDNSVAASSWGHHVVLDHGNGFYTLYAHLGNGNGTLSPGAVPSWQHGSTASSITVKVGDKVTRGQRLGYLGTTGNSTGTHAHIEMILNPQMPSVWTPRIAGNYFGGLDNVLNGGKELSEISWYSFHDRTGLSYQDVWGED
jgi:murein DD-endopeptidase MepM/ murein hydrolase activator NlpD